MVKRIMGAVLACLLTLPVAACSEGEGSSTAGGAGDSGVSPEIVDVVYWHEDADEIRTEMMEKIISWNNENAAETGINIIYEGFPSSNAYEKISVAISGNSTPDIGGAWGSWLTDFILQDALVDLDERFAGWEEKEQFMPSAIETLRQSDINNQHLYALPYTTTSDGNVLWYRADRFAEYGVTPPETWEDFFSVVEQTTFADRGEYGFTIRGGKGAGKQLLVMLYAYAGAESFFDENGVCFMRDNPDLAAFLDQYAALYNRCTPESDLTASNTEMVAAFDSGIANMMQHNLLSEAEHVKVFEKGQYQAIPLPVSSQGHRTLQTPTVNSYVMYSTARDQDAAWKALTHLASKEGIACYQEYCGEVPPRLDVQQMEQVTQNANISALADVLADPETRLVTSPTYLPEYKTIESNVVNTGFQEVLTGAKTGAELLTEMADAYEASYRSYTETYGNALR